MRRALAACLFVAALAAGCSRPATVHTFNRHEGGNVVASDSLGSVMMTHPRSGLATVTQASEK